MNRKVCVAIDGDIDQQLTTLLLEISASIGRRVTKKEGISAIVNMVLTDSEGMLKSLIENLKTKD